MNPLKALGPDELHPSLKELASKLGPMFAHLFQQSIDTGEITKEWSLANICPLYMKGDRSLACYYPVTRKTEIHRMTEIRGKLLNSGEKTPQFCVSVFYLNYYNNNYYSFHYFDLM